MYSTTTDHDHGHNQGHSHSHSHEGNGHAHSHSHSQSPAAAPVLTPTHTRSHSHSHTLGPPEGRRTHRYSPSVGHGRSPLNSYAFPPPDPIAEGESPAALAYAAAMPPPSKNQSPAGSHSSSDPLVFTLSSLTTPLLVTTTLVLASLSCSHAQSSSTIESPIAENTTAPIVDSSATAALFARFFAAATISSGTLFLAFLFGFIRQRLPNPVDEGGGYARRKPRAISMQEVAVRVAGVWACYLATLQLGGVRAAMVVLSCLAAELQSMGLKGLVRRKAVLGTIFIAAGWDIWRGMATQEGEFGIAVAYVVLFTGMVGLKNPWSAPTKPTRHENNVSLVAACVLGSVALIGWAFGISETHGGMGLEILACVAGAASMAVAGGIKANTACGAGVFAAIAGGWAVGLIDGYDIFSEAGLGALALAAISSDCSPASPSSHSHGHSHGHTHDHAHHDHSHDSHDGHGHNHSAAPPSAATKFLLHKFESTPLIHAILVERDSRRISYFMCLNFFFMIVQTLYGFLTGSLGLISDSVHMFFDCLALGVGLSAAVMSKRPPSARYPYGLGKMDTLAGFANGIFLMLISVEIVFEALERLRSPTEMSRLGELFFVSAAGLAVNMVGIFAFDHAHMHGGGGGHSHSHGGGGGDNMHGIFLHILADALGSVSVVISTVLIHYTSWPGFDPLASMLIALLIFASSVPLVTSAAKNLLLTVDGGTEYTLRDTIAGISDLPGVRGYQATRFWDSGDGVVRGVVHVTAEGDPGAVRRRCEDWIKGKVPSADVTVVVERGDENSCWCRRKDQ